MSRYTISEIAERSGFTSSTLRYYEQIGLVPPAGRTPAGYRIYDDATLRRLSFVVRAKQLGCTLEEITDLIGIWDGDDCGPVQRRFHELVTRKLAAARHQITELTGFACQLATAAAHLGGPSTDGPCANDCACFGEPASATPAIACTLSPGERSARVSTWDEMLVRANARHPIPGGVAIAFGDAVDVGDLARLAAAEQQCCAFFSFSITVDGDGVGLQVRAPEGGSEVVAALFGSPH